MPKLSDSDALARSLAMRTALDAYLPQNHNEVSAPKRRGGDFSEEPSMRAIFPSRHSAVLIEVGLGENTVTKPFHT